MLAYIDPGAGSLIVQAIIGTLVAIPYLLRRHLGRVFRSLARGHLTTSGETEGQTDGAVFPDNR
jgi:hypothetical protein